MVRFYWLETFFFFPQSAEAESCLPRFPGAHHPVPLDVTGVASRPPPRLTRWTGRAFSDAPHASLCRGPCLDSGSSSLLNATVLRFPCTSSQALHLQGLPSPLRSGHWYIPTPFLCLSLCHSGRKQVLSTDLTCSYSSSYPIPAPLADRDP